MRVLSHLTYIITLVFYALRTAISPQGDANDSVARVAGGKTLHHQGTREDGVGGCAIFLMCPHQN